MKTTDLVTRAEETGTPLREWSRRIGLNPNAIGKARADGRLSPAMAAALATELGIDPTPWVYAALSESERSAGLRHRMSALMRRTSSRVWQTLKRGARRMRHH